MKPSATQLGQAWLGNFSDEEQLAARLLIDGLELIGQDRLFSDLSAMISDLATKLVNPIALVPVRELGDKQSYFPGSDSNARAALLNPNSFPGSEAIVANLAGSLRRQEQNDGPFVASPGLPNLRNSRCRTILYIDDFSGSGERIIKFDKGFRRHSTIRSWLSFKWVRIHVAIFSATEKALARLQDHFGSDCVHIHRICPTFSSRPWTRMEREAVERLCREHYFPTPKAGPYGYQGTRGLMVFTHSVPNNIPPILWQQRRRRPSHRWQSFFRNQSVPDELHSLFGNASPEQRVDETFSRLHQQRLANGGWRLISGGDTAQILLTLAALARRPKTISRVMSLTGLAWSEIDAVLRACRQWGLVGSTLQLTDEGRNELTHAKGLTLRDEIPSLHGSTDMYYPQSLRVGR